MENFNESILCQNGIGILDYLSDGRHQEELMKEVSRLGDSELSGLYEKLFQGDAKEVSGKKILRKLFNENEQIKLIKESILQNEFCYVKKLLKKKDVYWFAEKMIAQTNNKELIEILLSRRGLGWAAQNVIVEYGNPKWNVALIEKQSDLSAYAKNYIIVNGDDDCVNLLASKAYLSFSEKEDIVKAKRFSAIKVLISKSKEHLPKEILLKIFLLDNEEMTNFLLKNIKISDGLMAFMVENAPDVKFAKFIISLKKPGRQTQRAILGLDNLELYNALKKHVG